MGRQGVVAFMKLRIMKRKVKTDKESRENMLTKICVDVLKKQRGITRKELKAIARKHNYPWKAFGDLSSAEGYLTTGRICLTKKGLNAAHGIFR